MSKRKRRKVRDLPLFDLPLQGRADTEGASPAEAPRDENAEEAVPSAPAMDATRIERAALVPSPVEATRIERASQLLASEDETETGDEEAAGPSPLATGVRPLAAGARPLERLLAGIFDLAVHVAVLAATALAVYGMDVPLSWADWPPFAVLALVFSFLYWFVPLAFWGRTPGMAWVGHVAQGRDGEPLTFGQTVRRWLGALVTLALAGLPLLLSLRGRSLSDRLSESRTVRE